MRNKIFQWLWYKIVKPLVPVCAGTGPKRDQKRIKAQFALAKLFGPVHGVIIGDSESQMLDTYKTMSKFESLIINMGEGGTIPLEWYDYFTTTGKDIYDIIKKTSIKKIWSIGGNCSLRSLMEQIPGTLQELHDLLPDSWIMLVPPVHAGMLAGAGTKTREQWLNEMALIRAYQRSIFNPFVIDTFSPFVDPQTGEATILYLKDPVHFSDVAVWLIEKVLNKII